MKLLLIWIGLCSTFLSFGQDTLKVYFLHGSKPQRKHRQTERKWFGGKHGGHVGIAINASKTLNFLPTGKGKIFRTKKCESKYVESSLNEFWNILGKTDSVKSTVFKIPIENKNTLDSIRTSYIESSPYDYALFGFRCASATYEILAQLSILKEMTNKRTIRKIFYPKILRKKLTKKALENWIIETTEGNNRRKWER